MNIQKYNNDFTEITLNQIYFDMKKNVNLLLMCSIFGFIMAILLLQSQGEKYQSTAIIKMANITQNTSNNNNYNGITTNVVENSSDLAYRMGLYSSYTEKIIDICKIVKVGINKIATDNIKWTIYKNNINIVELLITADNPEEVLECISAISDKIIADQTKIIEQMIKNSDFVLNLQNNEIEKNINYSFLNNQKNYSLLMDIEYINVLKRISNDNLSNQLLRKSLDDAKETNIIFVTKPVKVDNKYLMKLILFTLGGFLAGIIIVIYKKINLHNL